MLKEIKREITENKFIDYTENVESIIDIIARKFYPENENEGIEIIENYLDANYEYYIINNGEGLFENQSGFFYKDKKDIDYILKNYYEI